MVLKLELLIALKNEELLLKLFKFGVLLINKLKIKERKISLRVHKNDNYIAFIRNFLVKFMRFSVK
jgi:hypothetical protein